MEKFSKLMSEGLQKVAGSKMRSILEVFTKNRVIGLLVGIFFTALIQSSNATTVMVVSFVNSGLMKLAQAPEIPEIPINRIPNPKITSPRRLIVRLFFTNITIRTPIMTNSGAISARSNAISCPVTVVPMFAPRIIPGA